MLKRWGKDAGRFKEGFGKVGERMGARMVKGLKNGFFILYMHILN
jgi:hypothetical protein